jgi:hypothetical protein
MRSFRAVHDETNFINSMLLRVEEESRVTRKQLSRMSSAQTLNATIKPVNRNKENRLCSAIVSRLSQEPQRCVNKVDLRLE